MLLFGRSQVHFNFGPSYSKPPLQYWLTTLSLPVFKNRTLAVRIWPLIYGLFTAVCIGWLAFLLQPHRPWAIVLAIAIAISCPPFCTGASRGLLDMGLAFFVTIAFVFAHLARKHAVWWIGVAVACWLAGLQKVPFVWLMWILILILRRNSSMDRKVLMNGWLFVSLLGAAAATLIWPALQLLNGMSLKDFYHQELVALLGPQNLGARPYFEIPYRLVITSGYGIFLLIAPFVVLLWRSASFPQSIRELSIVCLTIMGILVITQFRSVRYTLPILPALCLILAVVFHRLLEQKGVVRKQAAILLSLLAVAGLVQAKIEVDYRRKNVENEKQVAEELGALQESSMKTVLLNAQNEGTALLYDSFYLFHGNLRFPLTKYTSEQIRHSPPTPPVLGVCVADDFPVVQEVYADPKIQFTLARFIVWRID